MRKNSVFLSFLMFLILFNFFFVFPAISSEKSVELKQLLKDSINVFITCYMCDQDYIKTNINFVNFVRDRNNANVHIIITTERASNGGMRYTVDYIGKRKFKGKDNRTEFFTQKADTEEEIRKKLVKSLRIGLCYYLKDTPLVKIMDVVYDVKEKGKTEELNDIWNHWVFSLGLNFYGFGESSRRFLILQSYLKADRITKESKFKSYFSLSERKSYFEYDSQSFSTTIKTKWLSILYVKSMGEHFSLGGWFQYENSTYKNYYYMYSFKPSVEYDFFPYSESTRKRLTFNYSLGFEIVKYYEETIYGKLNDTLLKHQLYVTLDVKEIWGTSSLSLFAKQYLYDFFKISVRYINWNFFEFN